VSDLLKHNAAANRAFRMLFQRPDAMGKMSVRLECFETEFLTLLERVLTGCGKDVFPEDFWNDAGLRFAGETLPVMLARSCFEYLAASGGLDPKGKEAADFLFAQANVLFRKAESLCRKADPTKLTPAGKAFLGCCPAAKERKSLILHCDPFGTGRTFVFQNGRFHAAELHGIRKVEEFFGYAGPRRHFQEAFDAFAAGKGNTPLLVSSLPGHGKTQMTIAYAVSHPGLTLVLAGPETLENGLDALLRHLSYRSDRRFVLFFDDIVPEKINFYAFRTSVGGAFQQPPNVMIVLSSNYPFPPSILSRGRGVEFPIFDDVKCVEMVEDFLVSSGMRHPRETLTLQVAADYTEDFGQKRFPELSPRTLMRYLERYRHDPVKRRTMLALSEGEMVTRPDAQLFYDFNIQLMRRLYGQSYIDALREEKLRTLGD